MIYKLTIQEIIKQINTHYTPKYPGDNSFDIERTLEVLIDNLRPEKLEKKDKMH